MHPEVLYKYRDWNNDFHKKILIDNEIFLAPPSLLNDPFDSKIPIRFDNGNEEKAFEMALRVIKCDHPKYNKETQHRLAKKNVEKGLWKDPKNIEEHITFQPNYIDKHFGICSLSGNKNIILVWTHYGANHSGFCVGFNREKLIQEIKNRICPSMGLLIELYPVNYVERFPYIDGWTSSNDKNIIHILTTKSEPWNYEEEYRLILINDTNRAVELNDSVFQNVTFGIKMEKKHKDEIVEIIKEKQNNIPLFQAKLSEDSFKILFEEIKY